MNSTEKKGRIADEPLKSTTELARPKPCCACPDTKRQRDECFMANGVDSEKCAEFIELHRKCMAQYGYKI